jgi:hypothetical protein
MSVRIKSCFITAPASSNLDTLRDALKRRDIRIFIPGELPIGSDWLSGISNMISEVDLVIGVITRERRSEWVLFELGQAWAKGKQILLFAPPRSSYLPSDLSRFLTVRANLSNQGAIEFALDQLLAAPPRETRSAPKPRPRQVLGPAADEYLRLVENAVANRSYSALEQVVAEAFEKSGAQTMSSGPGKDEGVALAIWSDELQHYVGNPLLVEVKARIRNSFEAAEFANRLSKQVAQSGTRWGLLLYAESPPNAVIREPLAPNILSMALPVLLERMREETFPDIIKEMRNRRIHGEPQ